MNLKLKRLVRTSSSEQYALFDLDQLDSLQQPITIGKLDMHYTGEGVYGTILFWDDAMRDLSPLRRESLIQALLEEIAQPMGVPNEFVVEFFAPTLDEYHVFHNLDRNAQSADETDDEETIDDEVISSAYHGEPNQNLQTDVTSQMVEAGSGNNGFEQLQPAANVTNIQSR